MSAPAPLNMWTNYLAFGSVLPVQSIYETRMENDSDGKVLYIGTALRPNCPTDVLEWNLVKPGYDGNGFIDRLQKPDDDLGFKYTWDDRATYFS